MLGGIYRQFKVKTAAIVNLGDKTIVVPTNEHDYLVPQSYRSSSRVMAGMFGPLVQNLSAKNMFFAVPNAELKSRSFSKGYDLDQFDGLSVSSINRPFSRLMASTKDKCSIERWCNPFALITDGTRNINTFLYQMPVVRLSQNLLKMFHKLKLELTNPKYELFGIPGVTVFIDKGEAADELLEKLLNVPLSFDGDGIVVSRQWKSQIKVLSTLNEEIPLPTVFKMQGAARSKGITIGEFEANRLLVKVGDSIMPVDVLMNTQGKRKNKAANLIASGMRLRKYLGESVERIDTVNVEQLIELKSKYPIVRGTLILDGNKIGEVVVGINKFYLDLTHDMNPKVAKPHISYVQAQQIFETLDFPLLERFEKRDVRPELSLHDEQLTVIDGLITKLALYRREELI